MPNPLVIPNFLYLLPYWNETLMSRMDSTRLHPYVFQVI